MYIDINTNGISIEFTESELIELLRQITDKQIKLSDED